MKEKILCVLKKYITKTRIPLYAEHYSYLALELDELPHFIIIDVVPIFGKEKQVKKTFFGLIERTKDVDVIEGNKYVVEYGRETFEITKEEFDSLIELREEKIKEENINKLEMLCGDGV